MTPIVDVLMKVKVIEKLKCYFPFTLMKQELYKFPIVKQDCNDDIK